MLNLSKLTNSLLGNKVEPAIMALTMKHLSQEPIELPDIRNIVSPDTVEKQLSEAIGRLYQLLYSWQEKRRQETAQPSLFILPQIIVSDKGFLQLELREVASGHSSTYARIPLNDYFIKVLTFIYKSSQTFEEAKQQAVSIVEKKYVIANQKELVNGNA